MYNEPKKINFQSLTTICSIDEHMGAPLTPPGPETSLTLNLAHPAGSRWPFPHLNRRFLATIHELGFVSVREHAATGTGLCFVPLIHGEWVEEVRVQCLDWAVGVERAETDSGITFRRSPCRSSRCRSETFAQSSVSSV